jgi:hypothetical protein
LRENVDPQVAGPIEFNISIWRTDIQELSRPQPKGVQPHGPLRNSEIDSKLGTFNEAHVRIRTDSHICLPYLNLSAAIGVRKNAVAGPNREIRVCLAPVLRADRLN